MADEEEQTRIVALPPNSDNTNHYSLQTKDGTVLFTKLEYKVFGKIFDLVDSDADSIICGKEGSFFLRRSGLDNSKLQEIWRLGCDGTSQKQIGRDSWFVIMKLIALAQKEDEINMQLLYEGISLPLPRFGIQGSREYSQVSETKIDSDELSTEITETQTIRNSTISSFTQYVVATRTSMSHFPRGSMVVYRRFSDFVWLHDKLTERYPGVILPPLPEKKTFGNMDVSFVEQRRRDLDQYLRNLAEHPVLRQSFELQVFLDATSAGWAALKYLNEQHEESVWSSLFSNIKTTLGLSRAEIVIKTDEEYEILEREVTDYASSLEKSVQAAELMVQHLKGFGYTLSRISSDFSNISKLDHDDEVAHPFFVQVSSVTENASNVILDEGGKRCEEMFLQPLRYQLEKIRAVKFVIRQRETVISNMRVASTIVDDRKRDLASLKASSSPPQDRLSQAEAAVKAAEERYTDCERQLTSITQGLKQEMIKFNREKVTGFKDLMKQLVEAQIDCANKVF